MAMVELINAVLRCLPWGEVSSHTAQDIAEHLANNDVVQVVRCEYCKFTDGFREFDYATCHRRNNVVRCDDFCSYGERKDNDNCNKG